MTGSVFLKWIKNCSRWLKQYNQEGCTRALEKIDSMDVADVKRYLKELIKDNMTVGMEIIKDN